MKRTVFIFLSLIFCDVVPAQDGNTAKVERGSKTAKAGFRNENEIRDKFNAWRSDSDARAWLKAMNYEPADVESVTASKLHGEKADVEVTVRTKSGERVEEISIKLVSSPNGFNQIDKRSVATYAEMWNIPPNIVEMLKLYVGETPPRDSSRNRERMYLDEFDEMTQNAVVEYFTEKKGEIVSDLLAGDGVHAARWMMVTFKANNDPNWVIRSSADAIKIYSDGPVEITKAGNLRIGRITMQRKGGDNGRATAKMLQFKINPLQLFDAE